MSSSSLFVTKKIKVGLGVTTVTNAIHDLSTSTFFMSRLGLGERKRTFRMSIKILTFDRNPILAVRSLVACHARIHSVNFHKTARNTPTVPAITR